MFQPKIKPAFGKDVQKSQHTEQKPKFRQSIKKESSGFVKGSNFYSSSQANLQMNKLNISEHEPIQAFIEPSQSGIFDEANNIFEKQDLQKKSATQNITNRPSAFNQNTA